MLKARKHFFKFSLLQEAITLPQSGNVFQFDSTIELFCYRGDICVTSMTRFKMEITTHHQFDETYEYYFLEHTFR